MPGLAAPSVRDLGHLLLQLGDALVLVGDRVLDGFQLLQNLVQFGIVLLEDETGVRRAPGFSKERAPPSGIVGGMRV